MVYLTPTGFSVDDICEKYGGQKLQSSDFSNNMMFGFYLSRRVQKGNRWHPANDNLRGTSAYGTKPTNAASGPTGSIAWDYSKVQYFLFSTGDFSEWYACALACSLFPVYSQFCSQIILQSHAATIHTLG